MYIYSGWRIFPLVSGWLLSVLSFFFGLGVGHVRPVFSTTRWLQGYLAYKKPPPHKTL